MSDPYAELANRYDIMIDWPARLARERSFFQRLFADIGVQRVLDIGCATGHHARMFAEMGAKVVGLDPSAPMLAIAREQTAGENPHYVLGGFDDVAGLGQQFELITILGNTLAHVKDAEGLAGALNGISRALSPKGRTCIQVINYDNLKTAGSRWLPLVARQVDGQEILFLREHRHLGEKVEFTVITLLHGEEGWRQHTERSEHLPLDSIILCAALQHAGLEDFTLFGDFQGAPFDPATSSAMIVIAGKKGTGTA